MKIDIKKLVFYILITIGIGSLPALFVDFNKYKDILKPPFSPPGFIFPIIWTILFILMGISIYRVVMTNNYEIDSIKIIYYAQLIINALWTPIFFELNSYLLSFIWLLLLLILVIILSIKIISIDKVSLYLNLGIYILN